MRLFEFDRPDPLVVKLIAVADQLKTELKQDSTKANMSVDEFLEYLQKYDLNFDIEDLYKMKDKPPLNNLIKNLDSETIQFKGFEEPKAPDDEQQKIVQQMAKQASTLP